MRVPEPLAKLVLKAATFAAEEQYQHEFGSSPDEHIGRVRVVGSDSFVSQITDSLSALKTGYPYGYSLVQRYVRGIIEAELHQRNGSPIRVVFVRTTPDGKLPCAPNRFAAHLVRRAVIWRKQFHFGLFRSRKSQLHSLNRELHAMRLLQCDQRYFHRPTNLILNLERET
jgi:hypothetical protein